jgi:O-antigen/teichoic acid export membrane protein
MSLFALILNMGLTPAFLRCYAAAGSPEERREVVSTGCVFGVVTGCLTFLLGVGLVQPATMLVLGPGVPATYLLLSFSSLVVNYMANLPRTYLRALDRSATYTSVDLGGVFLLLILNIIFIAVLKTGLAGVLWSSFIVGSLQFVLLSGWAFYKVGFGFWRPHLHRMLGFGLPLILANSGLFVLNFSDRFFLQHLRSLETVGIYAVGYKFGFMMNYLFVQPFFVMWQSRMYVIHAQPGHRKIFKEIFGLYSFGLVYSGLAMSLFSREIVRVMVEPKFAASQEVIPVVVLSYVFYGLSYYAQLGLFLTDRTKLIGVIGAVAAGLNLVLNYVLILRYGMMGAAAATLLSFVFIAGVSYWCSQRAYRLPLDIGRTSLAIIVAIGLYLASREWGPNEVAPALLTKVLVLAAFPVLLWKTAILPSNTVATLVTAKHHAVAGVSRMFGNVYRKALS